MAEGGKQEITFDDVGAGIDLADPPFSGRGIFVLNNPPYISVAPADDTPVPGGLLQMRRQHCHQRAFTSGGPASVECRLQ